MTIAIFREATMRRTQPLAACIQAVAFLACCFTTDALLGQNANEQQEKGIWDVVASRPRVSERAQEDHVDSKHGNPVGNRSSKTPVRFATQTSSRGSTIVDPNTKNVQSYSRVVPAQQIDWRGKIEADYATEPAPIGSPSRRAFRLEQSSPSSGGHSNAAPLPPASVVGPSQLKLSLGDEGRFSIDDDSPLRDVAESPLGQDASTRSSRQRYTAIQEVTSEQKSVSESETPKPKKKKGSLLSVDAMLAPLPDAPSLFKRVADDADFRKVAEVISSEVRMDSTHSPWASVCYTWISPAFYHKPLYFEQPNLERYGQGTYRIAQPVVASAHFFSTIPLVPYKTLTHHPRERKSTLGHGRPGNSVPWRRRVILGESTVGEGFKYFQDGSGYK